MLSRLGPGHDVIRAWIVENQANIRLQEHRTREALQLMREALALKERALPRDHPDIANSRICVAEALFETGDADGAIANNLAGQEIFRRAYGPDGPWMAQSLSNLGEYLVAVGRFPEALQNFRIALQRWESQLGPDHRFLGYALVGMGIAHWKEGRPLEAVAPLERALQIREAHEPDPAVVAETRFSLARVLWDVGRERARARHLVEAARAFFERTPARADQAREVTRWLAEHPAA
jgi:tetratricopeptide (TPR) repeat protein